MEVYLLILLAITTYIYGAIPFGYIIGKIKGVDITKRYSRNIGTINVFRVLGLKYAILTFILDFSKGLLAFILGITILRSLNYACILFVFSSIGNVFSPFLGFKGGKAAANLFGFAIPYLIYTENIILLIILVTSWIISVKLTKISAIGNLVVTTLFLISPIFFRIYPLWFPVYAYLLIHYTHRENIVRILKGKENKIFVKNSKNG